MTHCCCHHCWKTPLATSPRSHLLFGIHKCSASVNECQWVRFFPHTKEFSDTPLLHMHFQVRPSFWCHLMSWANTTKHEALFLEQSLHKSNLSLQCEHLTLWQAFVFYLYNSLATIIIKTIKWSSSYTIAFNLWQVKISYPERKKQTTQKPKEITSTSSQFPQSTPSQIIAFSQWNLCNRKREKLKESQIWRMNLEIRCPKAVTISNY